MRYYLNYCYQFFKINFSQRIQPGNTLKNWHLKKKTKNAILNGCISKSRANSESKLTFSESSFNFLQIRVSFCVLYPPGSTAGDSTSYNPRCCCQIINPLFLLKNSFNNSVYIITSNLFLLLLKPTREFLIGDFLPYLTITHSSK